MLAVFALVALVLIVGASQSFQSCLCHSIYYQSNRFLKEVPSFLLCFGTFLDANGNTIAALSTLVIAVFAYFSWNSTNKLWKSTNELTRATIGLERPYLFVDRVHIKRDSGPGDINAWFIRFKFRNVGRAPAEINECKIGIRDKDLLEDEPDYTDAADMPFVQILAPNRTFWTQAMGPSAPIRMKEGKAVQFVVFGKIKYKDLMGNDHETRFSAEVSPNMPVSSVLNKQAYNSYD